MPRMFSMTGAPPDPSEARRRAPRAALLLAALALVADPAAAGEGTHWSLTPRARPPLPSLAGTAGAGAANPIDRFIASRLEPAGLSPAPRAGRRALIRRLTFDLHGLPPRPEEVEAFLADRAPGAWERLVDRLLASPRFGERWGRHWLDLVRFAETDGYERDAPKPYAWRYRDWVIRAFNEDQPYDRFALEQLAGDELPERGEETIVATGLLRLGTWNDEPNDPEEYKYERLADLVHTTSTAFLGVTVQCARCHDHKFDPVPQLDYYRMASVFWAGFIEPRDRALMGGPSYTELGFEVLGWTDRGREVPPLHLLEKGDPRRPGQVAAPGALSSITALDPEIAPPPADAPTTRRRLGLARWITDPRHPLTARVLVNRLWQHHFGEGIVRTPNDFGSRGDRPTHPELLDWLACELIDGGWEMKRLHRLLVTSGAYQMASSHPRAEDCEARDPANRLWWRANRRRLEAEALRDAMLAASGDIDLALGGPSFHEEASSEALEALSRKGEAWGSSSAEDRRRRSVYMFSKRSLILPLMTTFDFCDTTEPCPKRDVTTAPTQALALLNNPFVHARSESFARRLLSEEGAGGDPARRIERAWRLALGRAPGAEELAILTRYVESERERFAARPDAEELAWASLCHVLFNTNEFIWVD
jgi:hypothetical protein